MSNLENIKKLILSPILLIGLIIYYFAEPLFFNGILSFRDLSRYFYPLRYFTVDCLKIGIVPLWDPYIFCGTPHLALQQSVIFYPLSIIYYIFPFDIAFNLFLIIHIFLAGVFVLFLARRWGFSESASLLSAVIFMFSGYAISVINLATTLSSVIWLPVIVLFYDKALTERRVRDCLISALFLGIMFLGGEPSIFYSTLWALLVYSIFFWLNNRKESSITAVARRYIFVTLTAILLAAIQLIPFLELMKLADRGAGAIPYDKLTMWALPIKDTVSFILPFLTRFDYSKESYWKEQNWVILIYVGVFSILLIALTLFSKKNWRVRSLFFLGILFLFVSYGSRTPFYYIIYKLIPGFKFIRYPVRFLYITTFSIAMLCGAGFNAYIEGRKNGDKRMNAFFKNLLIALYAASLIFLSLHLYRDQLIGLAREFCVRFLDPKINAGALFSLITGMVNIKRFLGFTITGSLLLFLGLRFRMRQGIISFAFLSLVIADLFSAPPLTQIMLKSQSLHVAPPNIEWMKKDKTIFRFFASPKTREGGSVLKGATYEDAIYASKDALAANWPVIDGLYDASGYDSIRLADYAKLMLTVDTAGSPSNTRILDMLNVKYLVSIDEIDAKGYRLVNKGTAYLYENTNVLPRAFLVGSYKVLKKEEEIANRLKSKEFDPAEEVILEEEPNFGLWAGGNGPGAKAQSPKPPPQRSADPPLADKAQERVSITKYSPNEVIIDVIVNEPKFLVLSDTYYPGWKVYVDGRRERLYKANFILRTVHLKPGTHTVRFIFDPFTFKLGAIISLITLIIILFYIVIKRK